MAAESRWDLGLWDTAFEVRESDGEGNSTLIETYNVADGRMTKR